MSHNGGIRTCSCDSCQQWRESEEAEHQQLAADAERYEAIRQTVNCPDCHGDEWMMEPEGDDPGCHCDGCTDGKIDMARLLAVGAAVFNAEYMNRQAGEWRPVIVNALPSGSPRAAVFAEQLLDYLLQVQP